MANARAIGLVLVTTAVVLLAAVGVGCGTKRSDTAAHCARIPSWDECAKSSRCEPVRFTVHKGYQGPAWSCQPKP